MPHTEKLSLFLGRLKFISFDCSAVQASFIHWDFSDKLCSAYRNFKAEAKLLKREKKELHLWFNLQTIQKSIRSQRLASL